jgi:hypothetical protein
LVVSEFVFLQRIGFEFIGEFCGHVHYEGDPVFVEDFYRLRRAVIAQVKTRNYLVGVRRIIGHFFWSNYVIFV